MDIQDRLIQARGRLMIREPFYGHIAMDMVWTPSKMDWLPEKSRTMGVRVLSTGQVECIWNRQFVEKLTIKQLYFVIQHEIEHIVRMHCIRCDSRIHEIWNIACDMVVNGKKKHMRIGYDHQNTKVSDIPLDGNIIYMPEDWPEDKVTEYYYDKLLKESKTLELGAGKLVEGKQVDNHSCWKQELSDDESRQIVKDIVSRAVERSQGNIPGHLTSVIESLSKPIIKWWDELHMFYGQHAGNKKRTYSRRNRRLDLFGMPGVTRHAAAEVNVILDTSGSTVNYWSQFFAEIDLISHKSSVYVLQWDAKFKGYSKYRKGNWRIFPVHGRGGTDMAGPVEWLVHNNLIKDVQIMLTDGFCNYVDSTNLGFPIITIVTNEEGNAPLYGKTIKLDLERVVNN